MVLENVELTLIDSMEDIFDMFRWLSNSRPYHALGVDTETTGLDVFTDEIRLCQIGDGTHGWAFDWSKWRGLFEDIVRRWDGDYIFHNAPFDITFFDKAGIHIPRAKIHDTMVQARIVEPHMSMALKTQASRHIDAAAGSLQGELASTAWTWTTVPIDYEPYWTYGALDPVLAYKLHEHHYENVMRNAPKAYELEMAILWIVVRMREYGVHIDREYAKDKQDKFLAYCNDVEQWCKSRYNIGPGSNQAIINILREDGITFEKTTKSGALSLDGDVLEGIDHPLASAVLNRRKALKMSSTYLRFYVEEADSNDLIHPTFNSLGAKTSRMSCSNPNLQNLPRLGTNKFGDVVRNCITTRYDNGSLMMCDFDQIEMRILAHIAREPAMIEAFKSGGDFFVNLSRQLFDDPTIQKKDKRRQITKNAAYATVYGSGVRKFAQTAGIPESQGREFMNRWNISYPHVKALSNDTIRQAQLNKQTTGLTSAVSPLTNRLFVADDDKPYALVNYMIQGSAAEVNKMKLVELDSAGLGKHMFASIHDEVLLDVPRDDIEDVATTLHDIMNDNKILDVPVTAGISWGKRWGQKVDWE